jgi:hypothetical protein
LKFLEERIRITRRVYHAPVIGSSVGEVDRGIEQEVDEAIKNTLIDAAIDALIR